MKKIFITLTILFSVSIINATEARVESMGNNGDFLKDDISIFSNPATCFGHGNMLVGALGKYSEENGKWVRSDEWFGGWAVYPLASGMRVALGATLNRTTDAESELRTLDKNDFFAVSRLDMGVDGVYLRRLPNDTNSVDYLEAVGSTNLNGKIYAFGGIDVGDYAFALGFRYAGSSSDSGTDVLNSISALGLNFGFTGKMDNHLVEAGINYTNLSIVNKRSSLAMNLDNASQSFKIIMRDFFTLNDRLTLIPVVTLDKISVLGIDNTDLGIGVGMNRALHKGMTWAGFKWAYHTAAFPETIDKKNIRYSGVVGGVEESSQKLVFSFGIEYNMLWDFFKIRVGGNKVFEYLEQTYKTFPLKKGLYERDVDAVAWGISLGTPDNRLNFDVTVSEEFPYSNFLSGGEDGVLVTRISAALKF